MILRWLTLLSLWNTSNAFVIIRFASHHPARSCSSNTMIGMSPPSPPSSPEEDDDASFSSSAGEDTNDGGAKLAAELFKMAQAKGIRIEQDELLLDEEEDEEEEEEEEEEEDPFLLAKEEQLPAEETVNLTDSQLYSEVRERVLDTAGGFLDFVQGPTTDEEDDDDETDETLEVINKDGSTRMTATSATTKPYTPPETIPDAELTAGEVIMVVLDALRNNDIPTQHKGVEILFGFSSEHSQIKNEAGLTVTEYAEFLQDSEYKVLFTHDGATIDKGDYSFDGKRAYFTARLQTGKGPLDTTSVNFILSTTGKDENACWLIDSMLIRPQSMRRRRRR